MIQQPNLSRQPSGPSLRGTFRSSIPGQQQKIPISVKSCFLRRSSDGQENAEKFDVRSIIRSTLGTLCKLCQTRYTGERMVLVSQQCRHAFCENCMKEYICYKVKVNQDLRCPQEQCIYDFNTKQPFFDSLPIETTKRYEKYLLWKQTINNPNLKLCPTEDCNSYLNDFNKCPKCKNSFCSQCMLREHQGPCDINFQKQFKDWKRCPQCKVFIQRTQGCNHMTCRCSHQFCYICLNAWEPQHYECGQMAQDVRIFLQHNRYFDHLRQLSRCKQILLAFAMIIILPILVIIALSIFLICSVIGAAIAGVISPFYCLGTLCTQHRQPLITLLLFLILIVTCPLIVAIAAVIAFFAILISFLQQGWPFFKAYIMCIGFLFNPVQIQRQQFGVQELRGDLIDIQFQ